MRNLEIKATMGSLAIARRRLGVLEGATRHAILRQTDWYFHVPKGRLKLRVVGAKRERRADRVSPSRQDLRPDERVPAAADG